MIATERRARPMSDIRDGGFLTIAGQSQRVRLQVGVLILGDLLALGLAWHVAEALNRSFSIIPPKLFWGEFLGLTNIFWLFALATLLIFSWHNFYTQESQWRNYVKQAKVVSLVFVFSLVATYIYDPKLDLPRSLFFTAWISSIFAVVAFRLITTLLLQQLQVFRSPVPTFLLAPSDRVGFLTEILTKRTSCKIVGHLASELAYTPSTLEKILHSGAKEVIAEQLPETLLASDLYWQLRRFRISLRLIPSSLVTLHRRGEQEIFAGMPVIRMEPRWLEHWEYGIKRTLDIVLSLTGIMILAPLFLIVAIGIMLSSPGNAFYFQERVGLHGRVFWMWKFRSMVTNADRRQAELERLNTCKDGVMFKVKNDPRIFPFGRFIRRTSIDELPQLFNVLLGQMSLVGPRPLPIRDVSRFAQWHHDRHLVMPGITGLWQISGRSDLDTIDDAVRLDLYYIDNWSLNLDLQILLETIRIVLFGKGAY